MPRIRSIKPEFWTSGQVLECSTNARLMFIGLWNFCDDEGRHPLREKQIKAEVFPADDFTVEDIRRMLDELSTNGLVSTYVVDDKEYLQVNGWHHQRIDRKQSSKYPAPFDEHSTNARRTLDPDRKGREGKGEDLKPYSPDGERASPSGDAPAEPPPDKPKKKTQAKPQVPIRKIVELYHGCCPSLPQVVKLTPGREQAVRARWRNELPSLADWEKYFAVVELSDFLTGRAPPGRGRDRPWQADFDFLVKQGSVVKVMEGKYD